MIRWVILNTSWAAVVLAACDNGGEGLGGVDPSKALDSLTAAEATAVCEAVSSNYTLNTQQQCTVDALDNGTSVAACESLEQDCMANAASIPSTTSTPDCTNVTSKFKGCTATVGDVAACNSAIYNMNTALTCTSPRPSASTWPWSACSNVMTKCPSIADSGSGSTATASSAGGGGGSTSGGVGRGDAGL
jgi:hypothetical protein